MFSYWEKTSFFTGIDVAIIGSGIVGLTTALFLKQQSPALNIAIFERGPLPYGASTRNAGFACFGSMTELIDDLEQRDEEAVFKLVDDRWKGLRLLRELIGDREMHYEAVGGYEIFRPDESDSYQNCLDHLATFNKILEDITGIKELYTRREKDIRRFGFDGIAHMILNRGEGQINTGEMIKAMMRKAHEAGVTLFNGLEVKEIEDSGNGADLLLEGKTRIQAQCAWVATNGFARHLLPDIEVLPARNQVLITVPIKNLSFKSTFHYDRGYYYFRTVDVPGKPGFSRVLLGGGRNLAPAREMTDHFGTTPLIRTELQKLLHTVILPGRDIEIEQWWSGILGIGSEKKPIVKRISRSIGVSVRLGGMGIAIGSLVGKKTADQILQELA